MTDPDKIYVEIVTPDKEVFRAMVESLNVPTASGMTGVLADHAPLITVISIGVLEYKTSTKSGKIAVGNGFMEVKNNEALILVKCAELAEDIDEALRISQSKEFVDTKPLGVDEPISQGGTNVSGGQKQRLSIARAIIKKPEIYIFDDSFSALDFKTDAALREELMKSCKKTGSTVLLVAQRISSILHADQIIVLDEGRMVGKGTHQELIKSCRIYQEIASSQLSKEELANV